MPQRLSAILLVPTFLSYLSQSFFFFPLSKFFPVQNFSIHGLASSFPNFYPSPIIPSLFLLSCPGCPLGGVRVFFSLERVKVETCILTDCPSLGLLGALTPAIGWYSRLLATNLWLSSCRQFSPLPNQPQFAFHLKTNKFYIAFITSTPAHNLPFATQRYGSLYLFPVIIFHLSLSQI